MNNQTRSHEIIFAFGFLLIALVGIGLTTIAPTSPDKLFVSICLFFVGATIGLLFLAKSLEPKPVNWLTADVLFTLSFCVIHYAYFIYWTFDLNEDMGEIWYIRNANCPHTVCISLAMYLTAVNAFLFGFYFIKTKRFFPIINSQKPPQAVERAWQRLGRLVIRLGFMGFLAFVMIVGPARFFGVYSGTNNISFVANIFFQLGTVFLMAGMTIAMASRGRIFKKTRKKRRGAFGVGYLDMLLIATTVVAIGVHGDRSTLVTVSGAFIIAYSEFVKPLKLKTLAITSIVFVFFLGFILAFRSAKTESYDFDPATNINSALNNLGTSAVCGFVAVDYTKDEYSYGKMQVRQLLGIIPFGRRLFGVRDSIDNSSSLLLTLLIQGKIGKGVSGTGTSVFADLYFDFGFYGACLVFLLVGSLAKIIENKARTSTSIVWQVLLVTLVTFLAVCSRYTFSEGLIRFVLYSGLYVSFFCYVLSIPFRYRISNTPNYSIPYPQEPPRQA
ncbi:MAG: oligosaccharide repeat unit polymerase [Mariniblastus sp.]|nr:oligosaccharide repeat unit polymerase [Mariniblastus sp.]